MIGNGRVQEPPRATGEEEMTEPSVQELIGDLASDDGFRVVEAAGELGERGDRVSVEPLIRALSRLGNQPPPDDHSTAAVIQALGALGDPRAGDAVLAALRRRRGRTSCRRRPATRW